MDEFPPSEPGTKEFVAAQLSEVQSALEGYPAAELLDYCLAGCDGDRVIDDEAQRLVEHILTQWVNTIERDLDRFPPASTDMLKNIRRCMVDALVALRRVRALVQALNEMTTPA